MPGPRRRHGYYVLPVLHEGQFVGRVDPKLHRERGVLEARRVGFEPWFAAGSPPPAAAWGPLDRDAAIRGVAASLHSLARFTGAKRVALGRVTPAALRAPLARALREGGPAPVNSSALPPRPSRPTRHPGAHPCRATSLSRASRSPPSSSPWSRSRPCSRRACARPAGAARRA